ncbi:hypothetical protein VTO42DRAFT_5579 [Malbranchea cinnamomea]
MPVDADRRLSRLTAKLLRRSSSSSAKNVPIAASHSNNLSDQHHHSDESPQHPQHSDFKQLLHRRRHSQSPATPLPSESASSTVAPVNARPSSCLLRPESPLTTSGTGATQHDADFQDIRPQAKETSEQEQEIAGSTHGKPNLASSSSHPCPPAATIPFPPPPPSPAAAAAATAPTSVQNSTDPDLDEAKGSAEPSTAEAQKASFPHRSLEEYNFPAVSKENDSSTYIPRLSRHSTRSVAANSTRSLNAVNETTAETFTPPVSQQHTKALPSPNLSGRPSIAVRRQSLVPSSQQRLIKTLLDPVQAAGGDYFSRGTPSIQADMVSRKVWVKRPGCSPTLVTVTEEDLVDDLREAILRKYSNSLGRTFDAPDLILKLIPREPSSRQSNQERMLGPEEPVGRTLDMYYPGGQTVDEALIIELTPRRTPKPSPRHHVVYRHPEELHPGEQGEYFPPMAGIQTPNASGSISSSSVPSSHHTQPHSMAVITTGQLPPVPSPGSRGSWQPQHRPKYPRQHTSSPNAVATVPPGSMNDLAGPPANGVPPALPSPSTQNTTVAVTPEQTAKAAATPPSRVSSPRLAHKRIQKLKMNSSSSTAPSALPSSLLDGTVPPINVLIVEDNSINLKLLEAFMKRLKVRWQTAMNGREAVSKWRHGGFHLVLMDIQLPVMSGLEATREIRRLERVNGIGVFSKTVSGRRSPADAGEGSKDGEEEKELVKPEDILHNRSQFKSPVIIVALTASSLQSDRHEALAAGCNDFLTKPVNIMWLEQKVTEWGCMQALIDFDGWRKWRGFADATANSPTSQPKAHSDRDVTESVPIGEFQSRRPSLAPKGSDGKSGLLSTDKDSASSSSTVAPHHAPSKTSAGAATKKGARGTSAGLTRTTPG